MKKCFETLASESKGVETSGWWNFSKKIKSRKLLNRWWCNNNTEVWLLVYISQCHSSCSSVEKHNAFIWSSFCIVFPKLTLKLCSWSVKRMGWGNLRGLFCFQMTFFNYISFQFTESTFLFRVSTDLYVKLFWRCMKKDLLNLYKHHCINKEQKTYDINWGILFSIMNWQHSMCHNTACRKW